MCARDGCCGSVHAKGLCQKHYRAEHKSLSPAYCSIRGCDTLVLARGLCSAHYNKQRLYGDPLYKHPRFYAPYCRFVAAITVGDCWISTMKDNGHGYKVIRIYGRNEYVHRYAYQIWIGSIPDGCVIHHLCNNRACVRPTHLCAVPMNMHGHIHAEARTHCRTGHELISQNLYKRPDNGQYECRECRHNVSVRWAVRSKALRKERRDELRTITCS